MPVGIRGGFHPFLWYKMKYLLLPWILWKTLMRPVRTISANRSPPAMPTSWLRDGDLEGALCYLGKGWLQMAPKNHSYLAVDLRLT